MVCPFFSVTVTHLFVTRTFDTVLCSSSASGSVMGFTVVGLGMLDISIWFVILRFVAGIDDPLTLGNIMVMNGMGASFMALFARVGGGIYTKAADVGADLVGKVEAGIPEDDPRNPATIADNVGDNVGDVAGMGADLYESYCGSVLATAALGAAAFATADGMAMQLKAVLAPMLIAAVGIINAINLIDGIDGLASGLSGSALLVLGSLFLINGLWIYAMLSFATLGVLVPFFYYNVFGQADHGRKIFMGDTGSLTLGYILAFLAIRYASYNPDVAHYSAGAIVIAFSTLIVPMLDVVRVMIVRARNHRPLFKPDRNHIHHKFLDMGMSAHKAMISIVLIACLFSSLNILLVSFVNINIVFAGDIVIWVALSIWFEKAGNKKESLNGKEWVKRI